MKKMLLTLAICGAAAFADENVEYIAGDHDNVVEPSDESDASYSDYEGMSWSSTMVSAPSSNRNSGSNNDGNSGSNGSNGGPSNTGNSKFRMGLTAAGTFSTMYGYETSEAYNFDPMKNFWGVSGIIGVDVRYTLAEGLYLRSGLELEIYSGSANYEGTVNLGSQLCNLQDGKLTAWIVYLDIPLMFRYDLGKTFFVEAGANLGLRTISGGEESYYIYTYVERSYAYGGPYLDDADYDQDFDEIFSSVNFMLVPGFGFKIDNRMELELLAGIGLTRLGDADEYSPKMIQGQIKFTYWL